MTSIDEQTTECIHAASKALEKFLANERFQVIGCGDDEAHCQHNWRTPTALIAASDFNHAFDTWVLLRMTTLKEFGHYMVSIREQVEPIEGEVTRRFMVVVELPGAYGEFKKRGLL